MKTDPTLGSQVQQHLISLGLETPTIDNGLTADEKQDKLIELFTGVLHTLGYDLNDASLSETPRRVSKMWQYELLTGIDYNNFPKCTTFPNRNDAMLCPDEFVAVEDITIKSVCEHHMMPIFNPGGGGCTIAYIPNKKVIGISKLARLADFFARNLNLHESLCQKINASLQFILDTPHVATYIIGTHTCMTLRGVEDMSAKTSMVAMSGKFKDNAQVRQEFLALCNAKR
jgi:GTP cyclohydrolase I